MIVDLTVREIMDLAEYAGINIDKTGQPPEHELETIVCLAHCPKQGLECEDGTVEHYSLVMYFDDCPEEGVLPLGQPLAKHLP